MLRVVPFLKHTRMRSCHQPASRFTVSVALGAGSPEPVMPVPPQPATTRLAATASTKMVPVRTRSGETLLRRIVNLYIVRIGRELVERPEIFIHQRLYNLTGENRCECLTWGQNVEIVGAVAKDC